MAHVVHVTSDQLAAAGREDAAEILREIERQEAATQADQVVTDPRVRIALEVLGDLPPRLRKEVLRRLGEEPKRQIEKET
ncbi:hypothetical protein [Streptomyces sp. NRRL F-5135]|uniref:hypothetical protein n=1 Tax=Streptomyces sp. NRRL F-5135 TaxID=1463858 RepID=UPI001F3334AC|nr:hypothetical protein [Streptomyces sp. NRRL F-5135]